MWYVYLTSFGCSLDLSGSLAYPSLKKPVSSYARLYGFPARSVIRLCITFEHGMKSPQIISLQVNKPVVSIVWAWGTLWYLQDYPARHPSGLESHLKYPSLGPRLRWQCSYFTYHPPQFKVVESRLQWQHNGWQRWDLIWGHEQNAHQWNIGWSHSHHLLWERPGSHIVSIYGDSDCCQFLVGYSTIDSESTLVTQLRPGHQLHYPTHQGEGSLTWTMRLNPIPELTIWESSRIEWELNHMHDGSSQHTPKNLQGDNDIKQIITVGLKDSYINISLWGTAEHERTPYTIWIPSSDTAALCEERLWWAAYFVRLSGPLL